MSASLASLKPSKSPFIGCRFVGQDLAPAQLAPIAELSMLTSIGALLLKASAYGLSHLTRIDAHVSDDIRIIEMPSHRQTSVADDAAFRAASAHLLATKVQLQQYFNQELTAFNLTLAPKGTEFQRDVWQALVELPFGGVCSYAAIANHIGRPKAVRAVGAANGANPIAIIVPCHRVIGKDGSLTGYAYGLAMKQHLLNLETADFSLR